MNAQSKPICDTDPSRRGGIDLNAVTQADGGWIKWGGGKCPVPPETLVQVQYRNEARIIAERFTPKRADTKQWKWTKRGRDVPSRADIIAYRVVKP